MWENRYEHLLIEWAGLRTQVKDLPINEALHEVHDWWQKAPMVNHTIYINDQENWPLPWDLLTENGYCDVAKCLGIVYTLLLIEHEDINSLHIAQTDNYILVQVNNGEYTLNDQPGYITADQNDLHVKYSVDCEYLKERLK